MSNCHWLTLFEDLTIHLLLRTFMRIFAYPVRSHRINGLYDCPSPCGGQLTSADSHPEPLAPAICRPWRSQSKRVPVRRAQFIRCTCAWLAPPMQTQTHIHTHTNIVCLSPLFISPPPLSLSLSLSLSLPLSLSHTRTHRSHTRTHTHTHTLSLSLHNPDPHTSRWFEDHLTACRVPPER
jgi:hypothetical protein